VHDARPVGVVVEASLQREVLVDADVEAEALGAVAHLLVVALEGAVRGRADAEVRLVAAVVVEDVPTSCCEIMKSNSSYGRPVVVAVHAEVTESAQVSVAKP